VHISRIYYRSIGNIQ